MWTGEDEEVQTTSRKRLSRQAGCREQMRKGNSYKTVKEPLWLMDSGRGTFWSFLFGSRPVHDSVPLLQVQSSHMFMEVFCSVIGGTVSDGSCCSALRSPRPKFRSVGTDEVVCRVLVVCCWAPVLLEFRETDETFLVAVDDTIFLGDPEVTKYPRST